MNKTIITSLKEEGHAASYVEDLEHNIMVYVINGDKYVTHRSNETGYKDVYQSKYKSVFIRFKRDNSFINL